MCTLLYVGNINWSHWTMTLELNVWHRVLVGGFLACSYMALTINILRCFSQRPSPHSDCPQETGRMRMSVWAAFFWTTWLPHYLHSTFVCTNTVAQPPWASQKPGKQGVCQSNCTLCTDLLRGGGAKWLPPLPAYLLQQLWPSYSFLNLFIKYKLLGIYKNYEIFIKIPS